MAEKEILTHQNEKKLVPFKHWGEPSQSASNPSSWNTHAQKKAPPAPVKAPPAPAKAPAGKAALPSISLSGDVYVDSALESHKVIKFNVTVPKGLSDIDFVLVNWIQGYMKDAKGKNFKVMMYGSAVDYHFPKWQVDSVDPDPVYWSDAKSRWNYNRVPGGFWATDDPQPPPGAAKGWEAAINFKIGLYKAKDVPAKTSGSIGTTPIQILPWQYSVKSDPKTGKFTHPKI